MPSGSSLTQCWRNLGDGRAPSLHRAHDAAPPQPGREELGGLEQQRVHRDRAERACDHQVPGLRRHQVQVAGEAREHERELCDLGDPDAHVERAAQRIAEAEHQRRRNDGVDDDDDGDRGDHREGRGDDEARVEQHADGDEEQDRECVAQRQRLGGGMVTDVGLRDGRAREKRAEGERDAEHGRRAEGDAKRHREHAQREQLAGSGLGDLDQDPRHHAGADVQHQQR